MAVKCLHKFYVRTSAMDSMLCTNQIDSGLEGKYACDFDDALSPIRQLTTSFCHHQYLIVWTVSEHDRFTSPASTYIRI